MTGTHASVTAGPTEEPTRRADPPAPRVDLRLGERESLDAVRRASTWAEAHGLVTLWASEAAHDPFLPLAVAAQETTRLELGTGIAVAFGRTPLATAQAAWDLQHFSGGRFRLGLGTQVKAHVERRYGTAWHGAVPQLREYVECCRAIWACWQTGGRPEFRGRYYRFDLTNPEFQPSPLPEEHAAVPVWIAAVGPRMAHLAGEIADGVHVHAFHTAAYLRDGVLRRVREGRAAAGREGGDDVVAASSPVMAGVAHDEREVDELRRGFRAHVAFYASTRAYRGVLEHVGCADLQEPLRRLGAEGEWDRMTAMIPDDVLDEFVVVDEAPALGRRLRSRYAGALTQLSLYRGGDRFMDAGDWTELIAALGESTPSRAREGGRAGAPAVARGRPDRAAGEG